MSQTTVEQKTLGEEHRLTDALVERISEAQDEPEFMRSLRREGFERFEALPIPSAENSEEWRRTDVTDLDFSALKAPNGSSLAPEQLPERLRRIQEADTDRGALHLSANGSEVVRQLHPELEEQGVVVCSMAEALREYPEVVEQHFMTEALEVDLNKFSAAHAAFWCGGTFVYVPRNTEVEKPIEIHNHVDLDGLSLFDHTLIVVGPNSRVNIVESHGSDPNHQTRALADSAVEIFAGDGARVDYSHIQNLSRNYYDVSMRRGVADNASTLNWITGTLGSGKAKTSALTKLNGEGSETYLYGVMLANGDQHIDSDISTVHDAPYTTDEMLARGVVMGGANGIFRGVIDMVKGCRKSKGSLHERALMIGDGAEADAVPEMTIQENDVKAAHSASVGELDEKQLLYMQSRGIRRERARRLIIFGFFEPILKRLPVERVKQNLIDLVNDKLDSYHA